MIEISWIGLLAIIIIKLMETNLIDAYMRHKASLLRKIQYDVTIRKSVVRN